MRLTPHLASLRTIPRPIPRELPVTSAALPLTVIMVFLLPAADQWAARNLTACPLDCDAIGTTNASRECQSVGRPMALKTAAEIRTSACPDWAALLLGYIKCPLDRKAYWSIVHRAPAVSCLRCQMFGCGSSPPFQQARLYVR